VGGNNSLSHQTQTERWVLWFLLAVTVALYLVSAGIPALLDDTDSLYAEVSREMNLRHDWITPYTNAIRFLEKPPLLYWLMALSYMFCGATNAFTARLPTALAVVALVFTTCKIGERLFGGRAGLFGGLALSTAFGTFLFTRIIGPDVLLTLILSLFVYTFVRWQEDERQHALLLWMYALVGLAVLTKGLIGVVFPVAIVFLTRLLTEKWKSLTRLLSLRGMMLFLLIAVPWHLLVGMRNQGFFWFYFINEHVGRFLGTRYPMDYGTVPLVPFWLLHLVWLFPWSVYLLSLCWPRHLKRAWAESRHGLVLLLVWALVILVFFSFSSRLEYYTLPAFPALALLAGAACARLWEGSTTWPGLALTVIGALTGGGLLVIAALVSATTTQSFLNLRDNPALYVFYLGHLFDLTAASLFALRTPLILAGLGVGIALPLHYLMKKPMAKAVVLVLGMAVFYVGANLGFLIFAPRLTSRPVADEIHRRLNEQSQIVIDGEYEEGSSVAFYTGRTVMLHNGRSSTLEYGSYYADAPPLFLDDEALKTIWSDSSRRVFLVTFAAKQAKLDVLIPHDKFLLFRYGDKALFSNRPD